MFLWQLSEDWLLLDYKGLVFGRCQVWNLCFRYRCVPIAVLPKRLVSYHYVSFWNHIYGRNVRACWYSSSGLLPLGVAKGDRVRGAMCNTVTTLDYAAVLFAFDLPIVLVQIVFRDFPYFCFWSKSMWRYVRFYGMIEQSLKRSLVCQFFSTERRMYQGVLDIGGIDGT